MNVKIDKIIYPGKSLSKQHGKVIITNEGLPQEVVEITPIKEKKNYIEAKTIKTLEPSEFRTSPRCSHYKICSQYQYIKYPLQLEIKKQQVSEMLSHDLGIKLEKCIIKPSPLIWNYRNKAHLHIIEDEDALKYAYHVPGQNKQYQTIDKCFLISENINSFLGLFLEQINIHKLTGIKEILIRENSCGELLLSIYVTDRKYSTAIKDGLQSLSLKTNLSGYTFVSKNKVISIHGKNYIKEKIGDISYRIGFFSFFQINVPLLDVMIKDITSSINLLGNEIVLDLYCGVGTFGMAFAPKVKKVIGVESDNDNIEFLKKNIKNNGFNNFSVYKGTSERWIKKVLNDEIDILIIDPPRKGIGDLLCDEIIKKSPSILVYISCNLSTLTRDLKKLLTSYSIKQIAIYDFFPNTPHMEVCTILIRK